MQDRSCSIHLRWSCPLARQWQASFRLAWLKIKVVGDVLLTGKVGYSPGCFGGVFFRSTR